METIEEVYSRYTQYIKLKNKPTTNRAIMYKFKNYILPSLGKYKIDELNEEIYLNFLEEMLLLNFSESFYKNLYNICKHFFDYLYITYNIENIPLKIGTIKNDKIGFRMKDTWNMHEFRRFIHCVKDPLYHAFFNTLFFTGIRKGEALALKVSDLQKGSLIINKTITKEYFNGQRLILPPKTKTSNRIIKVDLFLNLELKRLIKRYQKEKNYNDDFYLFGGEKPLTTTTVDRKKDKYCELAHVKKIRIHDFRHSHATILYRKNVKIKSIQERLGHADISTTMNIYVHNNEREEKRLINKINLYRIR